MKEADLLWYNRYLIFISIIFLNACNYCCCILGLLEFLFLKYDLNCYIQVAGPIFSASMVSLCKWKEFVFMGTSGSEGIFPAFINSNMPFKKKLLKYINEKFSLEPLEGILILARQKTIGSVWTHFSPPWGECCQFWRSIEENKIGGCLFLLGHPSG